MVHHIVCKDKVDEDVLEALEHKDTTQQKLISAVKARLNGRLKRCFIQQGQ